MIAYTMLYVLQSKFLLRDQKFPFMERLFHSFVNGHAVQLAMLHFFIPLSSLEGYLSLFSATVTLTRWDLIFGWRLKAVNGGLLNISAKFLSLLIMDLQCLAMMLVTGGNLGSKVVANTGIFSVFFLNTFFNANSLGILFVF